jgi:hypothetical protein
MALQGAPHIYDVGRLRVNRIWLIKTVRKDLSGRNFKIFKSELTGFFFSRHRYEITKQQQ